MYIVKLHNGSEAIEIHGEKQKLKSGNVAQGINTIDSFSFSILPSNVGFDKLHDFTTLVSVYNTNTGVYEFQGRVLYSTAEMTDGGLISKSVVCESLFGYLCDSQQEYVEERNWTVKGLLSHIIQNHNRLLESEKHFTIRTVEVTETNDNLYVGIQRENTWDTIKKKLLDVLGGELQFEVAEDTIYLDYLWSIGETKTTTIELSKNMKAITRERDPSEYITRLIPLGAKLGENTEARLDISSVNGGKIYLDDGPAIEEYGIHVGYVEYDDITEPDNLLNAGKKWLVENGKVPVKYSITALDLYLLGLDIDSFSRGNTHPIKNGLLGIDDTARIIKKNIDVCEEVKSSFEIGEQFKTLSEIRRDQEREANAAIKVIQRVNGDYVSKHDNNRVVAMVNNSTEKVELPQERLVVNGERFGLSEDGTLTAKDAILSGKFTSTGQRNAGTLEYPDMVDVSVTIENGESTIKGTSTELLQSGAQQIGTGTDIAYAEYGSLKYLLLPWVLAFGYMYSGDGDFTEIGGIRSTRGLRGNPNNVDGTLEMYGDWRVSGNMTLASGEAVTSDENKKNTISDLAESEAYSRLFDNLVPSLFKYNDGTSDRLHIGFRAQQVKEAMEAAGIDSKDFAALCIKKNRDGSEDWSLRYSEFIAMNTLEIQKLKARIAELENKIKRETSS